MRKRREEGHEITPRQRNGAGPDGPEEAKDLARWPEIAIRKARRGLSCAFVRGANPLRSTVLVATVVLGIVFFRRVIPDRTGTRSFPEIEKMTPRKSYRRHLNCDKPRIDLVVMSNRNGSDTPLRALVNSILQHTSSPVLLNVVSDAGIAFLDDIAAARSPAFSIQYHKSRTLLAKADALVEETGFRTNHHSGRHAMQKLFLPSLDYSEGVEKVLALDDDMIFYEDLTPLWNLLLNDQKERISLHCPVDPTRVRQYGRNKKAWKIFPYPRTANVHTFRYCMTGMMGLPVGSERATDLFVRAARDMTGQYPLNRIYDVADQDVVNRMFAHANEADVGLIPCEWSCDTNSCRDLDSKHGMGRCINCDAGVCYGMHFLGKAFESGDVILAREEWSWDYYYRKNTTKILERSFNKRVSKAMKSMALWC